MPHHVRDHTGHRDHSYSPSRHSSRRSSHSPQARTPEFRFSVEISLLVRSRVLDHTTILGLQKELASRLTLAGVKNHQIAGESSSVPSENFKNWTITSSLSISSKPKEHKFGLRLISPFMPFSWYSIWKTQVRTVLSVLNTDFETTATHQCATHIHLVPTKGYWRLSQARSLAQSAVYHESTFDRLVPLYRRKNIWAKSNRHNEYLSRYPVLAECLEKIAAQTTFEGLAARMNWCARDSPTGQALRKQSDFQHDSFRWNFTPTGATQGYGAIEFRQLGGMTEAEDLISWITLIVLFAQVSVTRPEEVIRPFKIPTLARLEEAIYGQAERSKGPRGRVDLITSGIFEMADLSSGVGEGESPDPKAITIDEDQRLRWVEKEGGGVGNTPARAKYWSLMEDLSLPNEGGQIFVEPHW